MRACVCVSLADWHLLAAADLCTQFNDCCTDALGFNSEDGAGSACNVCGNCYADEILSCDGFCDQNTGACW